MVKNTNRLFNNSFSIKFNRGDICRLEINEGTCTTTSLVLVLSQTKHYFTYLCVNNLKTEIVNNELNIPIDKNSFKEIYDEELFENVKFMHILINQIKTNKSLIIKEVSGTIEDSVMDIVNAKLLYYLGIKNKDLKNETETYNFNNDTKIKSKLVLTEKEKEDLINNYCSEKKQYYSDKYGIPIEKISQKVASLRFQQKRKKEKDLN